MEVFLRTSLGGKKKTTLFKAEKQNQRDIRAELWNVLDSRKWYFLKQDFLIFHLYKGFLIKVSYVTDPRLGDCSIRVPAFLKSEVQRGQSKKTPMKKPQSIQLPQLPALESTISAALLTV